ncbi:hypothetical protein AVEN_216831-1 [Araneus ventricosus]|uniref:Integrase catalytic domain-containing protein n=1 Tax=Araneus ventricosus TaxID=182803 RepID=A0A4Y2JHZ3_ARAVE|nr:hypothetical protein AVEN_216831-1 [Araneus ventricosus]
MLPFVIFLKCSRALTCVDRFSSWPEVIPLKDIKAETVAFEFYAYWIARFGVPERLTSDQGRQFESRLFREFARLLGVKVVHTIPYHPQANGSVERLHRQLKSVIRAHATERWTLVLPSILLGIRDICERTAKLIGCGDGVWYSHNFTWRFF